MIGRQVAATAFTAVLLGFLMAQGVSASLPLVFAAATVFCTVVIACGMTLLRALDATDLPLVAAWPLGVTATGLALWGLTASLGVTAAAAFAIWAVVVIALEVLTRRRAAPETAPERKDLVGLVLCCAFTAAWCKDIAAAPAVLAQQGFLPAWIDFFIHGGVISQFGDARTIDRGAIWLADVPKPFYHYASYLLPAAFAAPLDQPGLPLATSVWLPIGFLSLAAAAYTLGASLGGAAGGVAALAALFVFPDASNYWLRNGFFSFHWNVLTYPGAAYALGAALLALVFLQRWTENRARPALIASAALVAATFLMRVHVFLLLLPAWLAVAAIASRSVRRKRKLYLALAGLLAIVVVGAYRLLPDLLLEGLWAFDEGRALERFLRAVHSMQAPTAYPGLYLRVLAQYGEVVGFGFGMLLVYPAAIGAFLLLFPVALMLQRRALRLDGIDAFPLALLALYAAHMMLAPTPSHHDATDLVHRPFVLLYAVAAIWTLALAVRWLSRQGTHGGARVWQTIAVATAMALPWVWSSAEEMARPKFNWGRQLGAHRVQRDVLAAADFLRTHARPGDTFATWELTGRAVAIDAPTELAALTAVPAYLARFWIHNALGRETRTTAITRYIALFEVAQAQDAGNAMQRLRELGVRWYVVTRPGGPSWDPQHRLAVWTIGNTTAVYDSGASRP